MAKQNFTQRFWTTPGFAACSIAVLIGIFARAWILGSGERMPGVNGAYSPVQVRSLLEKGALGMPDYPLTFAIHAAVAAVIHKLTGIALDTSIILAVKLCIAVLPPLAAVPVFVLCRSWCVRAERPRSLLPFMAATMVSIGGPFIVMTGNFDKNALALVWLASLLLALHTYMERRSNVSLAVCATLLVLLGLTHIGTFITGLLALTCVIAILLSLPNGTPRRAVLPAIVALILSAALTQLFIFWIFDSARVEKLLRVMANPIDPILVRIARMTASDPVAYPGSGAVLGLLVLCGFAAFVIRTVYKKRGSLTNADFALVCGCVCVVVLTTGPWVPLIYRGALPRLALIAVLPAVVAGMFAIIHCDRPRVRQVLSAIGIVLIIVPGALQCVLGGWRILSDDAYTELKSLSSRIARPERTLVVAMHGVEWDVAWVLGTRVAQPSAVRPNDWQNYDEILYLEIKDRLEPFGRFGNAAGVRKNSNLAEKHSAIALGPFALLSPVTIPPNAETVHDGEHLRLARVPAPPGPTSPRTNQF